MLIYAKGGYTNTKVESVFEDRTDDDDFIFEGFDDDNTLDGFRVGAGIEQLLKTGVFGGLGSGAYAKLEYRYSNYNDLSFDDELFGDEGNELDIDLDRHQAIAGVGIRF